MSFTLLYYLLLFVAGIGELLTIYCIFIGYKKGAYIFGSIALIFLCLSAVPYMSESIEDDLPNKEESIFDHIEVTSEYPEKLEECRKILLLTDKIGKTLNAEYIWNYERVDITLFEIDSGKVLNSQSVIYCMFPPSNLDIYSYEDEKVRFNIDNFTSIEINIDFIDLRICPAIKDLKEDEEYIAFNRLVEELKEITDTYEERGNGIDRLWITMEKEFSKEAF